MLSTVHPPGQAEREKPIAREASGYPGDVQQVSVADGVDFRRPPTPQLTYVFCRHVDARPGEPLLASWWDQCYRAF